jgi:hypothetical protein
MLIFKIANVTRALRVLWLSALLVIACGGPTLAQTTSFTYQGKLTVAGSPANGNYDFQFAVFNVDGTQIGSTLTLTSVAVTGGIFTVQLDFGANVFPGGSRFLEISVRPASVGAFTVLSPRQPISSTPYGIRTLSASTADTATNATQLGGVVASQYVTTTNGATNFIQNATTQQAGANFNISGNGTLGGGMNIDQANGNNGTVATGNSLTFGFGSGEGIASKRNSAGNQFGLDFYTQFANRMSITSGGNVGIGTTNPATQLHATGRITTGQDFSSAGAITFRPPDGYAYFHIDNGPGGGRPTGRLRFSGGVNPGDNEFMSILQSGNVGIGTTAPLAKLDTRGDVFVGLTAVPDNTTTPGNNIYVADDGGGDSNNSYRIDAYNNNLYFVARSGNASGNASLAGAGIIFRTAPAGGGETDRMTINQDGNVTIGTIVAVPPVLPRLLVEATGTNLGVWSIVQSGEAVAGQSTSNGIGVEGDSNTGAAVRGSSGSGNIFEGFGANLLRFRVTNGGDVHAAGTFMPGGADFAEMLPAEADLEAGDVLVIGRDGKLARSSRPRQTSVAGVYSTKPGFVGGQTIQGAQMNNIPLAVVGIVPVKVTTENGQIRPGDLLTSSSTPGRAMRAGARPVMGTVIGKALGALRTGSGVIQMLAILQ